MRKAIIPPEPLPGQLGIPGVAQDISKANKPANRHVRATAGELPRLKRLTLGFLDTYIREYYTTPTFGEIQGFLCAPSVMSVSAIIRALNLDGYLETVHNRIRVTEKFREEYSLRFSDANNSDTC